MLSIVELSDTHVSKSPGSSCWLSLGPAQAQSARARFEVVGATIAETQKAIIEGRVTCREAVERYLGRIRFYDQLPIEGLRLNSIVTVNPNALAEADACDKNFHATRKLPPSGRHRRAYQR